MLDGKYFIRQILTGLLVIFSLAIFFLSGNIFEKRQERFQKNGIQEVKIGKNIFQAEVAATSAERSRGLSNRKELCENCAMLFLFERKGFYSFWMKEMEFDLDMLWVDKDAVVFIAKNVSHEKGSERIEPDREADKILEINAGLADKLGIKIGDRVEF